ncbi:hypothetical protein BDB00DRAFT_534313 [Zychaea mexicana]|uniref:uncharacterized protein n=1 Tax=Zychaea mexicana TaxID=64656 RepID=UPI0022FE79CF|nr:uncharacterized protein BDB00DRAFT_534313 [Zychaea mexicana]KAI9490628.1 hypothetical protein BDB00DRAFT_534313 [Zychaea mexicana]
MKTFHLLSALFFGSVFSHTYTQSPFSKQQQTHALPFLLLIKRFPSIASSLLPSFVYVRFQYDFLFALCSLGLYRVVVAVIPTCFLGSDVYAARVKNNKQTFRSRNLLSTASSTDS